MVVIRSALAVFLLWLYDFGLRLLMIGVIYLRHRAMMPARYGPDLMIYRIYFDDDL